MILLVHIKIKNGQYLLDNDNILRFIRTLCDVNLQIKQLPVNHSKFNYDTFICLRK